jgi:hypothetical protein
MELHESYRKSLIPYGKVHPPSRWIAGGIKICAVSNFINTGGGGFFFLFIYEKGSKGKRVLLQDM